MRGTPVVAVSLALLLAACGKPAEHPENLASSTPAAEAGAGGSARADAAKAAPGQSRLLPSVPMLAYSYGYLLSAPAEAIRDMVGRHENACIQAGPTVCQITGASVTGQGGDRIEGQITLRATPEWLNAFRTRLQNDTEAAGGRIVRSNVATEDLSRDIVDAEAAIRAQTALRDQMQGLLSHHRGKLADLVELRKQLAQVQGELDAGQSALRMMRARVGMSELRITYQSATVLAPEGVWSPLGKALGGVVEGQVAFVSGLVMLLAWVGPWALLLGGGVWLFHRYRRRRPAKATT